MIPPEPNKANKESEELNELLKDDNLCNYISSSVIPGFILFSSLMTVKIARLYEDYVNDIRCIPTVWIENIWFIISLPKKLKEEVQNTLEEIDMMYIKAIPAVNIEGKNVTTVIPDITSSEEENLGVVAYPIRGRNFYSIFPSKNHPVIKELITLSDWREYELQTASEIIINSLDPDKYQSDKTFIQVLNSIGIDIMSEKDTTRKLN